MDPLERLSIKRLVVLDVDATINPAVANYLQTELKRAEGEAGSLVVMRLNTPGGLLSTTKDILTMVGRTTVPFVVWITPEGASATSAGAIIASSAHVLLMNRGTNIGAATPVTMGEDLKESDGRSKAINDLSAVMRSLSNTRGRNAEAFSRMISEAASFTAEEALAQKIADAEARSLDDIRALLQDKPVTIQGKKWLLEFAPALETVVRPMDAGQRLLNVFAHPTTAYVLFLIGVALIYFEFQAPGGYIAGAAGVLCLLTAGISFQVLPLNYGAVGLMLAGMLLLILEVFITSYGMLALAGLACLGTGSLFLFRHEDGWLSVPPMIVFSTLGGVAAFMGIVGWFFARDRHRPRPHFFDHASDDGVVTTSYGQEGEHWLLQVKVRGEIWRARATEALAPGTRVRVERQSPDNLILDVTKVS